jgi:hypothetical protein
MIKRAQNEFILPLRLTVFIHKLMVEQLSYSCSCRWKHGCFSIGINGGWEYQNDSFVDKFSETQQILVANFIGMAKLKKSKT